MFEGLDDVDWASMSHAYGSAGEVPALLVALGSADAEERGRALDRFYGAVHHQGDVYRCTTASLPYLLALAGDPATPDRAAVVRLLVSIASEAVERCAEEREVLAGEGGYDTAYAYPMDFTGAAAVLRAHADAFTGFAADADVRVRRAAIPALGLLPDDAERAAGVLRARLAAESGVGERLLVVEAMATLALRRPEVADAAMSWSAGLAGDTGLDPETRLAALVHAARCAPGRIGEEVVPAAIGLLRETAGSYPGWGGPPPRTVPMRGAPPQVAAVLAACHPIAGPAREALAAHVAAQRARYGPDVWAAPEPLLRRAHQEAVRALARLGDVRALPSLLTALDGGVDAWRAVEVAGALPRAARELVPRLRERLCGWDVPEDEMSVRAALSALATLGDPTAIPAITGTLSAAVRHDRHSVTCPALAALTAFGPAAADALPAIRPLTAASADIHVRPAAVTALWEIGGDRDAVMPLLHELLEGGAFFWKTDAADLLGRIGPPAAAALPRLRELLTDGYEWIRVHGAAALWEIGGAAEADLAGRTPPGVGAEPRDGRLRRVLPGPHGPGRPAGPAPAARTAGPPPPRRPLREHRQGRGGAADEPRDRHAAHLRGACVVAGPAAHLG